MQFEIIPAIDLIEGRCVRLMQGRYDQETVYDADPVQVARRWRNSGAGRLHIVDLDGARVGEPQHVELMETITRETGLPVQFGGGLRDIDAVERVLQAGAAWAILGTAAINEPEFLQQCATRWPERILVSLDLRDGRLAVRGWLEASQRDLDDVLLQLKQLGLMRVIVTDVGLDGTLSGVKGHIAAQIAERGFRVILAGGVRDLNDIAAARTMLPSIEQEQSGISHGGGIDGVIVGRALYAGTLDLEQAIAQVQGEGGVN